MYLSTELILFSPLILYACFRVLKLLPSTILKRIFVPFCIFLFLGYPIAEQLSHREMGSWARYITLTCYFCLPYLLYFTLLVAAIDVAILLARGTKLLKAETISGSAFRSVRLGCSLIIPALIVLAGAWNNNRLQVKEYSIDLPQRSSTLTDLRIVYASDFHLGPLTNEHLLERFVAKVNALQPDIVLIGGDVLEGHGNENLARYEAQFLKLRAKYGVFAAPGNHESRGGFSNEFFAQSGMKLLQDSVERIDNAFYLAGRRNGRFSNRKSLEDLLKSAPENLPIILLDHSPTDLESVSRSRADLQLSGHTHNGQLFPVNLFVMPFQYELPWGMKVKRNVHFIVSSGIQAWGPPVKTAGDSEILLIKVAFRSEARRIMMQPIPAWACIFTRPSFSVCM